MDRLNKTGRVLMEYRYEFQKHYSESIDEALKEAISSMYNDKKIDEKIFRNIFNENIPDEDFERILSKSKEFTKSTAELNYEFDQIRKKINEYMISIGFVDSMNTKNSIDMNKIIVIHQFDLNKSYLMASFGVNQTEIIPLMKRRGFIEKFAVLRLNQVLKEIYNEMRVPEDIDHGYSLVYYNKVTQGFSIDYKYYINVSLATNEEKMKLLVGKIKELDKVVDKKFHNKLGNNYFINIKNDKALEIKNNEKPVGKQLNIETPQKIVEQTKNAHVEKNKNVTAQNKQDKQSQAMSTADAHLRNKQQQGQQQREFQNKQNQQNQKNKPPQTSQIVQPVQTNQEQKDSFNKQQEQKKRELQGGIPIKKNLDENNQNNTNSEQTKKLDSNIVDNSSTITSQDKNKMEPIVEEFEIEFDVSDKDLL